MPENLLIIFAKNPVLGSCKTRLAKGIGPENALAVYRILLQHTTKITRNLKVDKEVFYTDFIDHEDNWDSTIYKKSFSALEIWAKKCKLHLKRDLKKGIKK
jgi:glycosyltransferase A (GT-A) superfamily protein (DUF2064 family)